MSIKKLTYCLQDADITLRSDHLLLKKFFTKNTLNSKVNNWAIEILPFRFTFEYINGIKNTLADTMSRLIDIDLEIQLEPEPEGYEFGYYAFDQLPELEVSNFKTTQNLSLDTENEDASNDNLWNLPIGNDDLHKLQKEDVFCKNILNQIERGNIVEGQLYLVRDKILKMYILDGDNTYETTVVPKALTA